MSPPRHRPSNQLTRDDAAYDRAQPSGRARPKTNGERRSICPLRMHVPDVQLDREIAKTGIANEEGVRVLLRHCPAEPHAKRLRRGSRAQARELHLDANPARFGGIPAGRQGIEDDCGTKWREVVDHTPNMSGGMGPFSMARGRARRPGFGSSPSLAASGRCVTSPGSGTPAHGWVVSEHEVAPIHRARELVQLDLERLRPVVADDDRVAILDVVAELGPARVPRGADERETLVARYRLVASIPPRSMTSAES